MENFANPRRALVTGGARGIGAAIAFALQSQGIEVIAPSRQELDLGDRASVAAFLEAPSSQNIDILVNNAGINFLNEIDRIADEDWDEMLRVNLTAPMALIRSLSPAMKSRQWGRIVNISSIFSLVTRAKRGAYSAAKSGLNGLTRTAAVELAPHGILVNAICPGYVETELTYQNNSPEQLAAIANTIPARRLARPEEIANLVAFLCSEKNTYLTGQTITIDGGFTCQ
jgi:NAD(P)-dependent dehydrogenase (short-subunit alcohol dehydrogenase family)